MLVASRKPGKSLNQIFDLKKYLDKGYNGTGVKIAVFDSGLGMEYQDKELLKEMNIVEIIDFT